MSRAKWSQVVSRWRRSGLTAGEFAAKAGVNANTLSYWAWQLKRGREGSQDKGKGPVKRRRDEGGFPVVEVVADLRAARFELELVSGLRLRVPPDFDAGELARLLAVVEARR
jgi:transposase